MSETTAQPKPTPGRRRQGRNNGRTAAQKAYASEGDIGPHTPEKHKTASPVTNGKQRSKNNKSAKAKQATSTSPEPDRPAQHTTPQHPSSAKVPNTMAFAGATFHASPAPSALPMPSFLSKVTSASGAVSDDQGVIQQPSPPTTDADAATPQRPSARATSTESPLDFMFRAHRQEKEKQRGDSTDHPCYSATPPSNSPFGAGGFPQAPASSQSRPGFKRHISGGGIDSHELDGHFGQPTGPAFATPYQDRIKAARSSQGRPLPGQENIQQHQLPPSSSEDPTEALKKFLFGGNKQSPSASTASINAYPPGNAISEMPTSPAAARSHDARFDAHQGNKIQAMENDLRRILNIEASPAVHNTERRFFTQ